jgi:hypothetical protein
MSLSFVRQTAAPVSSRATVITGSEITAAAGSPAADSSDQVTGGVSGGYGKRR